MCKMVFVTAICLLVASCVATEMDVYGDVDSEIYRVTMGMSSGRFTESKGRLLMLLKASDKILTDEQRQYVFVYLGYIESLLGEEEQSRKYFNAALNPEYKQGSDWDMEGGEFFVPFEKINLVHVPFMKDIHREFARIYMSESVDTKYYPLVKPHPLCGAGNCDFGNAEFCEFSFDIDVGGGLRILKLLSLVGRMSFVVFLVVR